jgi:hypothetical protein
MIKNKGELKKRIDEIPIREAWFEYNAESVHEVLDEAKKEYPSLTSLGLVPSLDYHDLDKLCFARHQWYLKWFGDSP